MGTFQQAKNEYARNKHHLFNFNFIFNDTIPLSSSLPSQGWNLDLSFAWSQGEYNCMWRCPRPGLNPSGLVNNSSLAAGPQFTEVKIL